MPHLVLYQIQKNSDVYHCIYRTQSAKLWSAQWGSEMAPKNIALFFDGTWNKPATNTNVFEGFNPVACDAEQSDGKQITKYIPGVGSAKWTWLRGGAFGKGIRKNITDGYQFLADNYVEGDQIFLFGFSRGAYTARSLAGMIVRYGLIKADSVIGSDVIFQAYTKEKEARQLTKLRDVDPDDMNPLEQDITTNSRRVDIQFMGLWDTVGMIGIPEGDRFGLNSEHKFHHHNVSSLYQNIAHALAIDENRSLYKPTLFFKYSPDDEDPEERAKGIARYEKRVEQRWFAGSHGCIGGSYGNANEVIPMAWIYDRAKAAGLMLNRTLETSGYAPVGRIEDSYSKSFMGIPALLTNRYHRSIGRGVVQREGYQLACLNEKIDATVFDRCRDDPNYRPIGLVNWAQSKGIDLGNTNGDKRV